MFTVNKPVKLIRYGVMFMAISLMVLCMASTSNAAVPSVLWEKNFGGDNSDIGHAVWQTSDGGYVLAGNLPDGDNDKLFLQKTDASGNQLWVKTYGEAGKAYTVRQTRDGGYIMSGFDGDYCVLYKTDASGNEQWHKQYVANANTDGWSVQETEDGGFIVAGDTYLITGESTVTSGPNWDVWILRTDANGNELWTKTWGAGEESRLYSVDLTNDGGYIFGGTRSNVNDGDAYYSSKPYLVKTDASGNIQWEKTYNRDSWDNYEGTYVQQTSDGGYMLAGYHGGNIYLLKADASGNKAWDHDYRDSIDNNLYSAQQAWDGGYVLAGWTQATPDGGDKDAFIVRTDASGNELWKKRIGGTGQYKDDDARSIIQNGDGYYLATGETLTYTTGQPDRYDVYFFKLDKDMTPVPNAQVVSDNIPTVWDANKAYTVQVTFKNTGTKPWTFQDNTTMGYSHDASRFGVTNQTIRIGKVVRPNQEYKFEFVMTAPAMNGTYNPRIQMVWEGHQMFGAVDNKTIKVVNGTPNPNEPVTTATTVAAATPTSAATVAPTTGAVTSTPTVTQAPTTVPVATAAATATPKGSSGLPCLPSIILPLLIVGMVSAGIYKHRNKGN